MTKDNQMAERVWIDRHYNDVRLLEHMDMMGYVRADIVADTIAAKDRALDVALEALKYARENLSEIDGADEITANAIAQIEAVRPK